MDYLLENPEILLRYHLEHRRPFIAVAPGKGVVLSGEDEDELQAKLNDLRPSVRRQLFAICTSLMVMKEAHA